MGNPTSKDRVFAWMLLLPGRLACDVMGRGKADNRDLVGTQINSLVRTVNGVVVTV